VNRKPIVVTRAGEAGRTLARALADAGEDVLWLPAFELGPAPDGAHVAAVLGNLGGYDLAVFVSPAAVEATAPWVKEAWPAATAIGAVGSATRRAVLARIAGAAAATLFAPDDTAYAEGGGSESLWSVLQPAAGRMKRALILRAEHGREWLGEQLSAAGLAVDTLAVYARKPCVISIETVQRLQAWQAAQRRPVLVVASSEAVDAIARQLDPVVGPAWTRAALALASHERIAERLRAAGFTDVRRVAPEVEAIRNAALVR
jgi:uroporphyrinogen-III synthase